MYDTEGKTHQLHSWLSGAWGSKFQAISNVACPSKPTFPLSEIDQIVLPSLENSSRSFCAVDSDLRRLIRSHLSAQLLKKKRVFLPVLARVIRHIGVGKLMPSKRKRVRYNLIDFACSVLTSQRYELREGRAFKIIKIAGTTEQCPRRKEFKFWNGPSRW